MSTVNFTTTNSGSEIGTAQGGPAYPGDTISINGSTNLAQIIKGVGGSFVNTISIITYEGVVYNNKIVVNGEGPTGFGARVGLTFTQSGGETDTLTMASSSVDDHTVKCKSSGLIKIDWNFT